MAPGASTTFALGLEEGRAGFAVHALSLPGCVTSAADRETALAAFPAALAWWLSFLEGIGEPVPSRERELELRVEEWRSSEADLPAGESSVLFEADLAPLTPGEIDRGLRRLGELRRVILAAGREAAGRGRDPDAARVERTLAELARGQWWLLTRLGASPLAEVPRPALGQLDTALALTVQQFSHLPAVREGRLLELEGERWTPRKVLRRLLSQEGLVARSLGGLARGLRGQATDSGEAGA